MAQKNLLKNMSLSSVDFCFQGANDDSKIKLFKSSEQTVKGGEKEMTVWEKIGKAIGRAMGAEFNSSAVQEKAQPSAEDEANAITKAFAQSLKSIAGNETLEQDEADELLQKSFDELTTYITKAFKRREQLPKTDDEETGDDKDDEETNDEYDDTDGADEADETDEYDDDGTDDDTDEMEKSKRKKCAKSADNKEEVIDIMAMIDINKMAAEDKAILEELERKYADTADNDDVQKSTEIAPEVKKALDEVADLRKSLEVKDMTRDFEKYAAIGKKADDLAAELYELKKSNETAYNSVIAAYDEMLAVSGNSDVFKEFGSNKGGVSGAQGKVESAAAELRKSNPTMTYAQSIVKACDENPELKAEYENM